GIAVATNRARLDVVTDTEIFRVSHLAVCRPLGERDLDHDLRTRPVRSLVRSGPRRERTRGRLQRTQDCGHAGELALAEPGTRVADVDERPALPDAQEEGAEVGPAAAALRPSAHHTFLAARDLDLAPRAAAAPRVVGRVELLGDETLPAPRDDLTVQRAPVARMEGRETQPWGARVAEDALQPGAPRGERQRADVLLAVAQDVERDEGHGLGAFAATDVALGREMHTPLQPLEAGGLAVLVQGDDLAVEK